MRKEIIINGVNISEKVIQKLRDKYPTGTKIRLVYMNDPVNPVPPGTVGIVTDVDDIGNIHMKWENGSSLALIDGADVFEVMTDG